MAPRRRSIARDNKSDFVSRHRTWMCSRVGTHARNKVHWRKSSPEGERYAVVELRDREQVPRKSRQVSDGDVVRFDEGSSFTFFLSTWTTDLLVGSDTFGRDLKPRALIGITGIRTKTCCNRHYLKHCCHFRKDAKWTLFFSWVMKIITDQIWFICIKWHLYQSVESVRGLRNR